MEEKRVTFVMMDKVAGSRGGEFVLAAQAKYPVARIRFTGSEVNYTRIYMHMRTGWNRGCHTGIGVR